jgi:uncharacterized protein (TIGR04255 family)
VRPTSRNQPPRTRRGARPRHLANPPITEAQIDFRLVQSGAVAIESIKRIADGFASAYPKAEDQPVLQLRVDVGPGSVQSSSFGFGGIIRRSNDGRDVLQCRADGCAYSRLAPYRNWEEALPRALDIWKAYLKVTAVAAVRVTVRYINVIPIPAVASDLGRYLVYPPNAPLSRRSTIRGFLSTVTLFETDSNVYASVIQTALSGPAIDQVPIAVNIEAYRDNVEPAAVKQTLGILRSTKNRLFFGSLTPYALRRYS